MSAGFLVTPVGATQQVINNFAENIIYDAVVDANGDGDFLLVSLAVAAGHKTIYVRKGIYLESADIVLPSGFILIGESVTGCIISFTGASGFSYDGSGGTKETSGTISFNDGFTSPKNVTGSGTTFTNLSSGDYISLRGVFYEIDTITNNTALVLVRDHEGLSGTGLSYIAQTCNFGGRLENLTIINSQKEAIFVRAAIGFSMKNCLVSGNFDGIILQEVGNCYLLGCMVANNSSNSVNNSHGLSLVDCFFVQISTCSFSNNEGNGINVVGSTFCNTNVDGCVISENRDIGVAMVSGESLIVSDTILSGNRTGNVSAGASASRISITSCSISFSTGSGAAFAGEKAIISSCVISNNSQDGINVTGSSSEVIIVGNQITNNGQDGIEIAASVLKALVLGNYLKDNTQDGIDTDCINSIVMCNVVEGNTGDGIESSGGGYIFGNISTGNTGSSYNLSDATKSNITAELIEVGWYVPSPLATGTNVAGFLKIPKNHYIQEVHVSLDQRGDDGDTIVDINIHDVDPAQGTQKNAQSGTTIYTTSGNRPTLAGLTSNATDNAFLWAANPDIRDVDDDMYLSLDIDTVTTLSVGLSVRIILKRIPS